MAFDIIGAREAGHSDSDIAQYLSQKHGFNYAGAVGEGYGDQAILGHLLSKNGVGGSKAGMSGLQAPSTANESGYVGGALKSLGRGVVGIGEQVGQAMEWNPEFQKSQKPEDETFVNRLGRGLKQAASTVKDYIGAPEAGNDFVKKSVFSGVESLPASVAYALPSYAGAMVGGALGLPEGGIGAIPGAIAGAATGQMFSAPIMHHAAAQETADTLRKSGVNLTNTQIADAATKAGHFEWTGEVVPEVIEATVFSRLPGFKAGYKTIKEAIKPGAMQLLKNLAWTAPAEIAGEEFTTWGQTKVANDLLPADKQADMGEALKDTAGSTLVMTGLMSLLGFSGQHIKGNTIAKALTNAAADPEQRGKAAGQVYGLLHEAEKEGVAPAGSATAFLSRAGDAIGGVTDTGTEPYSLDLTDPGLIRPLDADTTSESGPSPAITAPPSVITPDPENDIPMNPQGPVVNSGTLASALAAGGLTIPRTMPVPSDAAVTQPVTGAGLQAPVATAAADQEKAQAAQWAQAQVAAGDTQYMKVKGEDVYSHTNRIVESYRKSQGQGLGAGDQGLVTPERPGPRTGDQGAVTPERPELGTGDRGTVTPERQGLGTGDQGPVTPQDGALSIETPSVAGSSNIAVPATSPVTTTTGANTVEPALTAGNSDSGSVTPQALQSGALSTVNSPLSIASQEGGGSEWQKRNQAAAERSAEVTQPTGAAATAAPVAPSLPVTSYQSPVTAPKVPVSKKQRNFVSDLRSLGGINPASLKAFGDSRTMLTANGGNLALGVLNNKGRGVDDVADTMLSQGWAIPQTETGQADPRGFIEMLSHALGKDPDKKPVHPDDMDTHADSIARKHDVRLAEELKAAKEALGEDADLQAIDDYDLDVHLDGYLDWAVRQDVEGLYSTEEMTTADDYAQYAHNLEETLNGWEQQADTAAGTATGKLSQAVTGETGTGETGRGQDPGQAAGDATREEVAATSPQSPVTGSTGPQSPVAGSTSRQSPVTGSTGPRNILRDNRIKYLAAKAKLSEQEGKELARLKAAQAKAHPPAANGPGVESSEAKKTDPETAFRETMRTIIEDKLRPLQQEAGRERVAAKISAVSDFIDSEPSTNKADYQISAGDRDLLINNAVFFLDEYAIHDSSNPMPGKFGHQIVFEPDPRAVKRLGKTNALVEYALHSLTKDAGNHDGVFVKEYDGSKNRNIALVGDIVKNADGWGRDKDSGKFYYYKEIREGRQPLGAVVLEMEKGKGNELVVRYVTFMPDRKMSFLKKLEPPQETRLRGSADKDSAGGNDIGINATIDSSEDNVKVKAPGSTNTIFTQELYEKHKAILKAKLSQLNAGIDPELMNAGFMIAGYHIESGARKFTAYAQAMVDDFGEAVRPYLKSFYNGVRDLPGIDHLTGEMDDYETVRGIDATTVGAPLAAPVVSADQGTEQTTPLQQDADRERLAEKITAVSDFIDSEPSTDKAEYQVSDGDRSQLINNAVFFLDEYAVHDSSDPMPGKFGHQIIFEPDTRAINRLGKTKALIEYALHSLTKNVESTDGIFRKSFDSSKNSNIGIIGDLVKNADGWGVDKKSGKVIYYKEIREGGQPYGALVLEMEKGKGDDLVVRYITFMPDRNKSFLKNLERPMATRTTGPVATTTSGSDDSNTTTIASTPENVKPEAADTPLIQQLVSFKEQLATIKTNKESAVIDKALTGGVYDEIKRYDSTLAYNLMKKGEDGLRAALELNNGQKKNQEVIQQAQVKALEEALDRAIALLRKEHGVEKEAEIGTGKRAGTPGISKTDSLSHQSRTDTITPTPENVKPEPSGLQDTGAKLVYDKKHRMKRGLKWADVATDNDALKAKKVVKAEVYLKPDYPALVDGGMHPIIAHLVKQVYDSIPKAPVVRGLPTDADFQLYIEAVNRVMDKTLEWANDKASIAAFAATMSSTARAAMGTATGSPFTGGVNLSELMIAKGVRLLDKVYPEGWKEYKAETHMLGNKVLGALQPGYDETNRAVKAVKNEWPASRESWQTQGYRIVPKTEYAVREQAQYGDRPPVFYVENSVGRETIAHFDSRETAEAWLAQQGDFLLLKKYGRLVSDHATLEEATLAAREKVKKEGKGDVSERGVNIGDVERDGPERRLHGTDVTPQELQETFGFKGISFGNWMPQDERQLHANHAYDAFCDLAELLNVPPKALSLNGLLGLAFGAQGSGRFAAHFVPGVNEINITRTSGAGSMGHEFAHALDHYFANLAGWGAGTTPYLSERKRNNGESGTVRPEILKAFNAIVGAMTKRAETIEETLASGKDLLQRQQVKLGKWLTYFVKKFSDAGKAEQELAAIVAHIESGKFTEEDSAYVSITKGNRPGTGTSVIKPVADIYYLAKANGIKISLDDYRALEGSVSFVKFLGEKEGKAEPGTKSTRYLQDAHSLDAGREGKPYWSTTVELFARAFDAYLTDKAAAREWRSEYLSHADRNESTVPHDTERTAINTAFDALVGELKTVETERGVALFSRAAKDSTRIQEGEKLSIEELTQYAHNLTGKGVNAPQVVVVDSPADFGFPAPTDAVAAYFKGTLFMSADNVTDAAHAREAIVHEMIGHFGLHGFFGSGLSAALDKIHDSNPLVQQYALIWAENNRDLILMQKMTDKEARYTAIEEAMASLSEKQIPFSYARSLVATVQKLLRAVGMNRLADRLEAKTNAQALKMLKQAELYIKHGLTSADKVPEPLYPLFMTAWHGSPQNSESHNGAGQTKTESFRKWFGNWDISSQAAEQLRGETAVDKLLEAKSGEMVAMSRPGLGDIVFTYGRPGRLNTKGRLIEGEGLSHLVAQRDIEGSDGEAVARAMPGVIANGEVQAMQGEGTSGERVRIVYDGMTAVLSLYRNGEKQAWLLTGWDNKGGAKGVNPTRAYSPADPGISQQAGALSENIIALNKHLVKTDSMSKVVDSSGKPLVVYHGTGERFWKFKPGEEGGSFFTTNENAASDYGDRVEPVYLNIRKPYDVTERQWLSGEGLSPEEARDKGYDGYVIRDHAIGGEEDTVHNDRGDTWIAFSPEQIKSVDKNNGDFSVGNPDIRYDLNVTRENAVSHAIDRAIARERGEEVPEAVRTSALLRLRKLEGQLESGEISDNRYIFETRMLYGNLERKAAEAKYGKSPERVRGADYIRQRLLEAKRRGDISAEESDFAEWFIKGNPDLLEGLGISIRQQPAEGNAAGNYNPLGRIITIIRGHDADTTTIHEILHHLERMMPAEIRKEVRKAWRTAVLQEATGKDAAMRKYVGHIMTAQLMDKATAAQELKQAGEMIVNGEVPYDAYALLNPSEFWAVNATRITGERYAADNGVWATTFQWLKEALQHIKKVLGLENDAAVIRALNSVVKGEGVELSDKMLSSENVSFEDKGAEGLGQTKAWDIPTKLAFIENGDPIATMEGTEVPQFGRLRDLAQWVGNYWKNEFGGKSNNPDLGEVVLDSRAASDSIAPGLRKEKAQAFYLAPKVISDGVLLGKLPQQANKPEAFLIGAPVRIGDNTYKMYVEVRRDSNMQRLYVHEVVVRKENPAGAFNSSAASPDGEAGPQGAHHGAIYSFLQSLKNVKPDVYEDINIRRRAQEAMDTITNLPDGAIAANLKQFFNPLDWSRFVTRFEEALVPPALARSIAYMLRTPVHEAQKDIRKSPFVETAIQRETDNMEVKLRVLDYSGPGAHQGVMARIKGWATSWGDNDPRTAWGLLQNRFLALDKGQRAAFDLLNVEGDINSRSYSTLVHANQNPRIRAAGVTAETFAVYWDVRRHMEQHVPAVRNQLFAQTYLEGAMQISGIAEGIASLDETGKAQLDEALREWTQQGAIYDKRPDHIAANVWTVYAQLRDIVKPRYIKSIADARKRDAELTGWMHRFHGEGEWATKAYMVIDRLTFDVKEHSNGLQAVLPYFPGQRLAGELAALAGNLTRQNPDFDYLRLANGKTLATGPREMVERFVNQAQGLEIDNPENGRPDRVLTYVRYVALEGQAKRLAGKVAADLKGSMPSGHVAGMTYEVKHVKATGLTEEMYGDINDKALEAAQREAMKKALTKGEISKEEYEKLLDQIIWDTAEVVLGRAAGKYQIRRADYLIEGYDRADTFSLFGDYQSSMAGQFSKMLYSMRQTAHFRNSDRETQVWAYRYINDSLRNMGAADRASGIARSIATFMYLGFKPASVLVNGTQVWTLGIAKLGTKTKDPVKRMFAAQRDVLRDKLSRDEREMFDSAIWHVQEMETAVGEMAGLTQGARGHAAKTWQQIVSKALAPFQEMEMLNRKTAILAAYRLFRDGTLAEGRLDAEAMKQALEMNRSINFEMSKANLPGFARNPYGRTFYALQSFSFNTFNEVYNQATSGEKADMVAILRLVGAISLIGGAAAIPGGDEADKLYRRLFGRDLQLEMQSWTKRHLKEYGTPGEALYAFAWHGVAGVGGINLSNSLRVQVPFLAALVDGESLPEAASGVFGGMAQKVKMAGKNFARGNVSRGVENLAPEFVAAPMRAYRQATEGNTTTGGRPIFGPDGRPQKFTPVEAVTRAMGFQPLEKSEQSAQEQVRREIVKDWGEQRNELLDSLRVAATQGSRGDVMRKIMKWNRDVRESQAWPQVKVIKSDTIHRALTSKPDKGKVEWYRQQAE